MSLARHVIEAKKRATRRQPSRSNQRVPSTNDGRESSPSFERLEGKSHADAIRRPRSTFASRQGGGSDAANPETMDVSVPRDCLAGHRIEHPPVDRKTLCFFGFMQMLHWETTLALAAQENPSDCSRLMPRRSSYGDLPRLRGNAVNWVHDPYAALPLLLLSLIPQVRYSRFNTQLFWWRCRAGTRFMVPARFRSITCCAEV